MLDSCPPRVSTSHRDEFVTTPAAVGGGDAPKALPTSRIHRPSMIAAELQRQPCGSFRDDTILGSVRLFWRAVNRSVRCNAMLVVALPAAAFAAGVVDLQGGVVEVVLRMQEVFDVAPRGVAVDVAAD